MMKDLKYLGANDDTLINIHVEIMNKYIFNISSALTQLTKYIGGGGHQVILIIGYRDQGKSTTFDLYDLTPNLSV